MSSRRGNAMTPIHNNGQIDQDTWDADTQAIAQAAQDFGSKPIPDIQFAPDDQPK